MRRAGVLLWSARCAAEGDPARLLCCFACAAPIGSGARCIDLGAALRDAAWVAAVEVATVVLRWWTAASARGWCVSGRGGSWDPVARVRSVSAEVVVSGRRSVVAGGRHISGRNPCSGLHRSRQRRRLRVPRSFLEASSWRCSSFNPWLWLRRETSDPLDRAMEASSRLSPPWGHRLGAGYDWETGGWRHLRRVVCDIFTV